MSIDTLKSCADSLHGLTPEGRHFPHLYGDAAEKKAFADRHAGEKDRYMKAVLGDQLAKFVVVSPDDAARHAEVLSRKLSAADALVKTLGLEGPGKAGVIAEADARRYLVKTLRELRHQIAAASPVELDALAAKVAEHLGTENVTAVRAALETEHVAFSADHASAKSALGQHAVFHEDIGFLDSRLQG